MNDTFTIPEIRCNRHFYGATLCAMQTQAPINEGIVAIEPCAECLDNASDEVAATCRALRAELHKAESLWAQACRERNDALALLQRAAGIHAPNTPWTVKETVLSWGAWYRDYCAFRGKLISRRDAVQS